jgi:hypothetical protein
MLERAHDGRADGDDASTPIVRGLNRRRRRVRDGVRLGERQPPIELLVAGRRNARRVRNRLESDAAFVQPFDRPPTQHETGRRRFERHRWTGDDGPHVPERQRFGNVRVLNGMAMSSDAGPDAIGRPVKLDRNQAGMSKRPDQRRRERTEREAIAGDEQGRRGPMLGARAVIAGAKHHGGKVSHVARSGPAGEAHFESRRPFDRECRAGLPAASRRRWR